AFLRASRRYTSRAEYQGEVLFLQGTDSPYWGRNILEEWRRMAPNLVEERIDCTHREFLDEPHVGEVAKRLIPLIGSPDRRPAN
ncbi:MAG: hypothetical protein GWO24_16995, partial [Akkermansiaceae bacterium]|nr:hypothetical protein [Akkermansiaceae bacterium]